MVNFLLHAINVWLLFELALIIFGSAGDPALSSRRPSGRCIPSAPKWSPRISWAVPGICWPGDVEVLGGLLVISFAVGVGGRLRLSSRSPCWACSRRRVTLAVLIGMMLLWDLEEAREKPRWKSYAAVAASLVVFAVVRSRGIQRIEAVAQSHLRRQSAAAGRLLGAMISTAIDNRRAGSAIVVAAGDAGAPIDSFDAITPAAASDTGAWLSLLAVIAVLAVVCARRRKDSMPFWAAGFFAIALLPTSNLVVMIGSVFADRFLYLPATSCCRGACYLAGTCFTG